MLRLCNFQKSRGICIFKEFVYGKVSLVTDGYVLQGRPPFFLEKCPINEAASIAEICDNFNPLKLSQNSDRRGSSRTALLPSIPLFGSRYFGSVGVVLPQFRVDILNEEHHDVITLFSVRLLFLPLFLSSLQRKVCRKDLPTQMHSLVPLSEPNIKQRYVFDDSIPAENMMESGTVKGAEKTLL